MARLSARAHQRLQDLASRRGQSQQDVLDEALALLERRQFFDDAHQAYAALQSDPAAALELERERAVLDGALRDGMPIE